MVKCVKSHLKMYNHDGTTDIHCTIADFLGIYHYVSHTTTEIPQAHVVLAQAKFTNVLT